MTSKYQPLTNAQLKFLQDIPVNLTVDIGSVETNAAELLDIAQGTTFEFSFHPDKELLLSVEGEVLAAGRFVIDSERFGIEITRLIGTAQDCPLDLSSKQFPAHWSNDQSLSQAHINNMQIENVSEVL